MQSLHDARRQHILWVKRVKVGDMVCDCRYLHQRVVEVEDDRRGLYSRKELRDRIPTYFDKGVTLEDGSSCSLFYCCDRVDHKGEHQSQEELKAFYAKRDEEFERERAASNT